MHDFLLAKEIIDELGRIAKENKLSKIASVKLEIGDISMSHDGHPEHLEEINLENLRFGLEGIAKNSDIFAGTEFLMNKAEGGNWRIVSIDAE